MLTTEELKTLRDALPKNGYQLVSDKVFGASSITVRLVLTEPRRYRKDILDAAILVIEEFKQEIDLQRKKIREVVK